MDQLEVISTVTSIQSNRVPLHLPVCHWQTLLPRQWRILPGFTNISRLILRQFRHQEAETRLFQQQSTAAAATTTTQLRHQLNPSLTPTTCQAETVLHVDSTADPETVLFLLSLEPVLHHPATNGQEGARVTPLAPKGVQFLTSCPPSNPTVNNMPTI